MPLMKNALSCFLMIALFGSCSDPGPAVVVKDPIHEVETGLCYPNYLVGDATWTIEERMAHYGVAGMSIAVIKDNKIDWIKSYGVVDKETKEPVTDATLFQAGSISKPVSTYGALKLAELGLIALDADVNTQLHSWKLPENEFTQKQKVTPKLLLGHMAGTTVHGFLGYSPDLPVPSLVQVLNGEAPANSPPIVVDKLPGESFRYSGGGYCIIQQLMIDAKGATFPAIMDELVLRPLGMTKSTYDQPLTGEHLKMAATGYVPDGSMTKGKRHTYPEMAAAGLWTTAEDLARYVMDVQRSYSSDSGAVISKASAAMMLSPYMEPFAGVGMFLRMNQGEAYFGHGGWDEGFSSECVADRDKGYGVVVLTNANQPDFISEVIRSVARAYDWKGYVATYTKMEMDPAALGTVSGRYRLSGNSMTTISHSGGRLFQQAMGEEPVEMFRISDSTYISRDGDFPVQFKGSPADSTMIMVSWDTEKWTAASSYPRLQENDRLPIEMVLSGDVEGALIAYRTRLVADPKDKSISEQAINDLGYQFLGNAKIVMARDLFNLNRQLYPQSANANDSYAEACLKNGEKDLALTYYNKAFAMDPANSNAARVIKELEGKENVK